jgi:hypothetical protein
MVTADLSRFRSKRVVHQIDTKWRAKKRGTQKRAPRGAAGICAEVGGNVTKAMGGEIAEKKADQVVWKSRKARGFEGKGPTKNCPWHRTIIRGEQIFLRAAISIL